MATSLLGQAFEAGVANVVGPDERKLHVFAHLPVKSVGTRDLNGGMAVVVVSPLAAIVLNMSTKLYPTENFAEGFFNLEAKMTAVTTCLMDNEHSFFPKREGFPRVALIVTPCFNGQHALPEMLRQVQLKLNRHNLTLRVVAYKVSPEGHQNDAQGSVFIDISSGFPVIYVEDHRMNII